jgi:glutamine amidotransferase-like uncharacterized protein
MVKLASIFVAGFTLLSVSTASAATGKPIALVYEGAGGCTYWGCNDAAANVALSMGFDVKFVTPAHLTPEIFQGASLWMQPGGNAITVAQKIGKEGLALIRNFVRNGGAYVGFCAGAFLADSTVDDPETIKGLGILPVGTADYPIDSEPAGIPLRMNWNGQWRTLYFEGGGYFLTHGVNRTSDYTVFAWFPNGDAAALETAYGRGGVVVTGAHPEAPEKWKTDGGWHDPDGSDIFLAQDMVRRALRISQPPTPPAYRY